MPTPKLLDMESLLKPIPGDRPSGEDLKWDQIYEQIRKARKPEGDKKGLKDGETLVVPPEWNVVIDLAKDALTHRTKDLMLAAYLTEALINQHGSAGFRDGLQLLNGLLDKFWDSAYPQIVYPKPPEGGSSTPPLAPNLEPRLAPMLWCTDEDRGGRFPLLIRDVVRLIPSPTKVVFSWNYHQACFPVKGANEKEEAFANRKRDGEERLKAFDAAKKDVTREVVQNAIDDLTVALIEVSRLGDILQDRFKRQAPAIGPLRESVESCLSIVKKILDETFPAVLTPPTPNSETSSGKGASTETSVAAGAIRSREDAFNRLAEVATFLQKIEPHSPVSYLLQRALKWGRMPFNELLEELLKDANVRGQVTDLLGIKPSEPKK